MKDDTEPVDTEVETQSTPRDLNQKAVVDEDEF
jgi:hypothetical protein